jgi:hypothetical protein
MPWLSAFEAASFSNAFVSFFKKELSKAWCIDRLPKNGMGCVNIHDIVSSRGLILGQSAERPALFEKRALS